MNEIKNRKNYINKTPNSSKQIKKNTYLNSLNKNKENSSSSKYSQYKLSQEKVPQRNPSSMNKKSDKIKNTHFNISNHGPKQNIRRMYKEKKENMNNLSHGKSSAANKSINDSKYKIPINKKNINKNSSLNKIILSGSDKNSNDKKSTLEKNLKSYFIPKKSNINDFNSKTQINKIKSNKLYNASSMNQNNNIVNHSNNSKKIDISSQKRIQPNNIYDNYLNKYIQQRNIDNPYDNSNNKITKNKNQIEVKELKDINKNNKYHFNYKNENLNFNNININANNTNNKKTVYNLNYIHEDNSNDFQKRNKTVIGKKNVFSLINAPYSYKISQNKNDFEHKNNSILNNGKYSFKERTQNYYFSNFIDNEKDDKNNNIVNSGKYSFKNRTQDNKIIINNFNDNNEKDDKNDVNDIEITKKLNNIIRDLKNNKKDNFNNFFGVGGINIKDNKTDFYNNKILQQNDDKLSNFYDLYGNYKKTKNDSESRKTIENEIDNIKTKENNANYNFSNAYNLINKYGNSIIKRSNLNNGQDNNTNNDASNTSLIKESIRQNQKRDVISSINKNQINLINNRNQNNEIIKIDVNNLKGIYQNKRDLNKIKNYEIETAKETQKDIEREKKKEKEITPENVTQSLIGLLNLGETCYMNTGLQNIIHCKPFINQLFLVITSQFREILNEKIITHSFINLCSSLINNNNNYITINSYNPYSFRKDFCSCHKEYADRGQHDSLEFLRIFLDDISKELNQTKIISQYKELKTEGKSKEIQNMEYHKFYLRRENSIVVKVFYSQIMNMFICECGDVSYSFEKILDIPLLFPKEISSEIHLNDLLEKYFRGEKLSWSLTCPKCGKKDAERSKKIKLSILPEVIIFSLQRFNPTTGVKINKTIKFEEIIDLKSFCDFDFFNGGEIKTKYRLFGISNHSGMINYGHYYSYTKVGDNWYEFNDSLVKPINLPLMSRAAYFFFYEKKE